MHWEVKGGVNKEYKKQQRDQGEREKETGEEKSYKKRDKIKKNIKDRMNGGGRVNVCGEGEEGRSERRTRLEEERRGEGREGALEVENERNNLGM